MGRFIFGTLAGFLIAAVTAWAAVQVQLPKKTNHVMLVLDEVGEVVFGAKPAKVEVTNLGEISGPANYVIVDANGTLVGQVFPPGTQPSDGGEFVVSRETNGLQYLMAASSYGLDTVGAAHSLYYAQAGCVGPPLIKAPDPTFFVHAIGTTLGAGGGTFRVPLDTGSVVNYQSGLDLSLIHI